MNSNRVDQSKELERLWKKPFPGWFFQPIDLRTFTEINAIDCMDHSFANYDGCFRAKHDWVKFCKSLIQIGIETSDVTKSFTIWQNKWSVEDCFMELAAFIRFADTCGPSTWQLPKDFLNMDHVSWKFDRFFFRTENDSMTFRMEKYHTDETKSLLHLRNTGANQGVSMFAKTAEKTNRKPTLCS